jgi:hypothetical protein
VILLEVADASTIAVSARTPAPTRARTSARNAAAVYGRVAAASNE